MMTVEKTSTIGGDKLLLILTDKYDKHADKVINKLDNKNIPYIRFNLDVESLKSTIITFDGTNWLINTGTIKFTLNDIDNIWVRRAFVELTLEEQFEQNTDFKIWKNEWNKTLLGFYYYLTSARWLNPLRKSYKAENKYLQMVIAKKVGMRLPDTIISNCKNELLNFANQHNNCVVFKPMAQELYETDNGFKGMYVNKLTCSDLSEFGDLAENPIYLQEYIDKKFEIRYTVVGKEHLVCKIDSQKSTIANIDWRRYDLPNTPHYVIEPPNDIKIKVDQLMHELGLEFGALDFIVTKNNEWIFLEINSMGQWLWIENLTGLNISGAIANWIEETSRKEVHH